MLEDDDKPSPQRLVSPSHYCEETCIVVRVVDKDYILQLLKSHSTMFFILLTQRLRHCIQTYIWIQLECVSSNLIHTF